MNSLTYLLNSVRMHVRIRHNFLHCDFYYDSPRLEFGAQLLN